MMPAKPWCGHAEGFESGLRSWELDVGEWERASGTALAGAVKYTVMMNMVPIFLRNSLQLGTYAKSTVLRAAFLQCCYSFRNFGASPTVSAGNGTGNGTCWDDDNRMRVDSLKKGKGKGKGKHQIRNELAQTTQATPTSTCKNCDRTGHCVKDWDGDQVEKHVTLRTTITITTQTRARITRKAKTEAQRSTRWKRISLPKQLRPCRILHRCWVRLELFGAMQTYNRKNWLRHWEEWQSIPCFPHGDKFRVFASWQWCQILDTTQQVELPSNMTKGVWWHSNLQ